MQIFTIKKADPIGEKDDKYGWTIWAEAEETDSPVMFNSHKDPIVAGTQLVAEETESKTSKKGTAYLRLKRIKLSEPKEATPTQKTAQTSSTGATGQITLETIHKSLGNSGVTIGEKLDEIIRLLKKLVNEEETINLDDIPEDV